MECLQGLFGTESTVNYFQILDTMEAINQLKLHYFINLKILIT